MPRKRHTSPETLLGELVSVLERDDDQGTRHRAALDRLLAQGPLETEVRTDAMPAFDVSLLRAELLALLRAVVRHRGAAFLAGHIGLDGQLALGFRQTGRRVECHLSGPARSVVVWQLVLLLHAVGLPRVQQCPAPSPIRSTVRPPGATCGRLFVKTYRREFCSVQCQKRTYMRAQRQAARRAPTHAPRRPAGV